MIVYRLEDPDGHGPAYGRPENVGDYWARAGYAREHARDAYATLHAAIVYAPPTPGGDRRLHGVRRHEKFGVTAEQLADAARSVDGESFFLDCLAAYDVPAEDVRVGTLQCVFTPPGTREVDREVTPFEMLVERLIETEEGLDLSAYVTPVTVGSADPDD